MKKDSNENDKSALTFGRREFLVTSLVLGAFALDVMPIAAQTQVKTDAEGLTAGEVKIGEMPAYRAMPDKKGKKFPVVLVIHEIFGVHEHIQDLCRRFAKQGYLAIAPYLYAREGDVTKVEREKIMEIVGKVPDSQVMSDLDACIAWAKKNGGNTKKLSITGFCWGGRITWLYSAHNPKVDAGAAWYGRLVRNPNQTANDLQPTMPVDIAKDLKVPVLGLYGGLDTGIPLDTVQRMQDELKRGKSKSEIVVYPNAQHGFNADYRPSYNKESATDAWAKMLDWFKKNGAF